MNPKAITGLATISEDQIQIGERSIPLWSVAGKVFQFADGETSIAQLADALDLSESRVWKAVDELADAGLMNRVAPPVSGALLDTSFRLSRRQVMGKIAAGMAAVGAAGVLARQVHAQEPVEAEKTKTPATDSPAADRELAALKKKHAEEHAKWQKCTRRQENKEKQQQCRELDAKRKVSERRLKHRSQAMQESKTKKTR